MPNKKKTSKQHRITSITDAKNAAKGALKIQKKLELELSRVKKALQAIATHSHRHAK
jgi:hypothetical protein